MIYLFPLTQPFGGCHKSQNSSFSRWEKVRMRVYKSDAYIIPNPLPRGISIYTSTDPFSLEGEGWNEGEIKGCFYSPHPNPLQQERALDRFVIHWIYNAKKLCRYLCPLGEGAFTTTSFVEGLIFELLYLRNKSVISPASIVQ